MTKNIIIKTSVQKRFDSFMVHGRVLFFSAPCGFGKTVLADALLRGRNVLRQSAADPDCAIPPSEQDWDILLIDDLQLMQEEAGQQALCELIRSSPERRFVLLSRGVPPGCLTAFQYTGLMTVLEADDLLFDEGDVRRLFQLSGVNVTDSEINGILKESVGYPLADGRPDAALLTLSPMEPYIQNCARIIDGIHLNVLTVITLHRKRDEQWRGRLTAALDAVRTQAAFYPHFLEPRLAPGEELTPTELQILHLLCADKSNAEIAQIMDVKLPTVKTHVSHILDKLDVKRRAETRTAAKKLHLVQDDL